MKTEPLMIATTKIKRACWLVMLMLTVCTAKMSAQKIQASVVATEDLPNNISNSYYTASKAPLAREYFTKLPVTAFNRAAG